MFFLERGPTLALLLLVYPLTNASGQPVKNSTFEREKALDGKLGESSKRILESQKPSVIVCAFACHMRESCRSIAFQNSSETCYGYNVTFASIDREMLEDVAGYVILNKIDSDTAVDANRNAKDSNSAADTAKDSDTATDCMDVKSMDPSAQTGQHIVQPASSTQPFYVFCEMDRLGGGWTLLQQRDMGGIGETLFDRTFSEYETGFGIPEHGYWLGLVYLHQMTYNIPSDLLITFSYPGLGKGYEERKDFYIDKGPGYTLHVGKLLGRSVYTTYDIVQTWNVSSVLDPINGQNFSTFDFDQTSFDLAKEGKFGKAGWWYANEIPFNLFRPNGVHGDPGSEDLSGNGMLHIPFSGYKRLNSTKIMFRRIL